MMPGILAVCLLLAGPATGPTREVDTETLVNGLRDAERLFRNVSAQATIHSEQRSAVKQDTFISSAAHMAWTIDATGRLRFDGTTEMIRDADPPSVTGRVRLQAAFNGQVCKTIRGAAGARFSSGRVSSTTANVVLLIHPLDYLYGFQSKPVSHWLAEHGPALLAGHESRDGRRLAVVETKPVHDPDIGAEVKSRFWVDVGRAFSVTRKAYVLKYDGEEVWHEYATIEGKEYRPLGQGVWVPHTVTEEQLSVKKGEPPRLSRRRIATLTNWRYNAPLAANYFDLSIPPGILVVDEIAGKTYRTGKLRDEDLTAQFVEARAAADALAARERRTRMWCWAGGISAALLALTCSAFAIRRWRLRRNA